MTSGELEAVLRSYDAGIKERDEFTREMWVFVRPCVIAVLAVKDLPYETHHVFDSCDFWSNEPNGTHVAREEIEKLFNFIKDPQ
jgi:hypothetical protein